MHSETISDLAAALAKAQGAMKGAAKDSENPHFRSRYADLASVWDACRDALSANGLSVAQVMDGDDPATVTVVTVLMHASGQWMSSRLTMRPVKPDPQGVGSAITYARRYALAAMVGVAPEDDDGNAASRGGIHEAEKPRDTHEAAKVAARVAGEHRDSVTAIRVALDDYSQTGDSACLSRACEAWRELDRDTQMALWIAPTKMQAAGLSPVFTTEHRRIMQTTEFRESHPGEAA